MENSTIPSQRRNTENSREYQLKMEVAIGFKITFTQSVYTSGILDTSRALYLSAIVRIIT